jgi:hypothetical protein
MTPTKICWDCSMDRLCTTFTLNYRPLLIVSSNFASISINSRLELLGMRDQLKCHYRSLLYEELDLHYYPRRMRFINHWSSFDLNFYCVNLMRNSYYISLKSVPVISHNFDTINTSTIADANKFKPWKTYRRRSSVL